MHEDIDSDWIASRRVRTSLSYAAYITVFGLLCVLTAIILAGTVFRDVESMKTTMFVGVLFIGLVCLLFAGTIYLWLCMLFFLLKYDKRSSLSKCFLFVAFLL